MLVRAVLVWLLLMIIAIANGGLREMLISPRLGARIGHVASTVILCGAIVLIAWLLMPWVGARKASDGWTVGTSWLVLTLGFEFLAGHYLFGNPWHKLLSDYNMAKGRVWVLVPIVTFLAPWWAATMRNRN